MVINSIENGIVIDHIKSGNGAKILEFLHIDKTKVSIAFLMNATSGAKGTKDVIKVDSITNVNLDALGLIDPECTVNIIENGNIVKKLKPTIPERVENVIKCKNPRCVTSVEVNAPHIFHLINKETSEYKCEYCEEIINMKEIEINEILHT